MDQFQCDYTRGACPEILKKLVETNFEELPGYGEDKYCEEAERLILEACGCPEGSVYWLPSGTGANLCTLSALLKSHEHVVCADNGHIQTAEASAVEATGHRVIPLPAKEGKLTSEALEKHCAPIFNATPVDMSHLSLPGAVYITQPTEIGTVYQKSELEALRAVCQKYGLRLYLDGARLAYGLEESDLDLKSIASLTDAFYIGGTKCGALLGEAVVVPQKDTLKNYLQDVRMRGFLIAKGRLPGIEFLAFFEDGLYFRIGKEAVRKAKIIEEAFLKKGFPMEGPCQSNQVFPIVPNEVADRLAQKCRFKRFSQKDDGKVTLRFCTSWSTTDESIDRLVNEIDKL